MRQLFAVIAVAAGLGITGCGRSPLAPVSGRVTVGGKPVTVGQIQFLPATGRLASGTIQPDGSFVLSTHADGDGASIGSHMVTIRAVSVTYPNGAPRTEEELVSAKPVIELLVPEKYSDPATSGLTAEVRPGPNVIDFPLP